MRLWRRPKKPTGIQLTVTWSFPPDFGGLPHAVLSRTRLLASAGVPTQILTLHDHDDLDAVRTDLIDRHLLPAEVPLRNLWEELAGLDDDDIVSWGLGLTPEPATVPPSCDGIEVRRYEVLRPDGTMLAHQTWIGDFSKSALDDRWGDRCLETTLHSRDGSLLARTPGTHRLQQAWLDHVIGSATATIVADDAAAVDMVSGYHRPNVATSWVVHGNHLKRNRRPPFAGLSDWRKFLMEHRSDLGATVFLTEAQKRAADLLVPSPGNEVVIGHAVDIVAPESRPRDPRRGLVVGRLVAGKRVDHVVDAIAQVPAESPARIEVLGTGPERGRLESRIAATSASERVRLRGYVDDVHEQYATAGFMVLASAQEAFGLVVLEAMAAGCIPIAYDAPYGPADLIEHGVNGFLVPDGNRAALAAAIAEVASLGERRAEAIRNAARATADARGPKAVTAGWMTFLSGLRPNALAPLDPEAVDTRERIAGRIRSERAAVRSTLTDVVWTDDGGLEVAFDIELTCAGPRAARRPDACLVDVSDGTRTLLREIGSTATDDDGTAALRVVLTPDQCASVRHGHDHVLLVGVADDEIRYEDTVRSFRPAGAAAPVPLAPLRDGSRVTLHRDRTVGLTLRRPRPRVVADALIGSRGLVVTPTTVVKGVRLTVNNDVVTGAPETADTWVLPLPRSASRPRSWVLEALDDKGWTKIAHTGVGELPVGTSPFELRTTDYGYLRVDERTATAIVTAIDEHGIEVASTTDAVLVWQGPESVRVPAAPTGGTQRLPWPELAPGTWHLAAGTDDTTTAAFTSADAQHEPMPVAPAGAVRIDPRGRLLVVVS